MNDIPHLLLAAVAGFALGCIFFGGLWWTVRRGLASPRPALWFAGSFIVRTVLTLGGLYLVMQGSFGRLLAALAGFVIAKLILMRVTKSNTAPDATNSREAGHAS